MPLEILTSKTPIKPLLDPAITFPFECDIFQKHAFSAIAENNHVLVTAPTSSGKTLVAEYAIAHHLRKKGKIVYTSPIKSLSNEKYNDFKTKLDAKIGLLTGDNKIDVDGDVLIVTAEILRNALYKLKNQTEINTETNLDTNFIDSVTCVIMDEVHYINDPDRGSVWEETIILLNDNIQLIMLSATVENAEEFANWITSIKSNCLSLITTTTRIVPLNHYIYVNDEIYKIMDENNRYIPTGYHTAKRTYGTQHNKYKSEIATIDHLAGFLKEKNLLQTIFFSFSRANCEKYANSTQIDLLTSDEKRDVEAIFNKHMHKYKKDYEKLYQYNNLHDLILKGIAYHHSGLFTILKEIVEIIFKQGLIKILFATETFAVGINMPTRTVVFTELSKFTKGKRRFLNSAEYKQMSGRAGRRNIDTQGNVIILPLYDFPYENDLQNVLTGNMPKIISKFKIDYQLYLKSMYSEGIKLDTFFDKSLMNKENNKVTRDINFNLDKLRIKASELNRIISDAQISDMEKIKNYYKLIHQSEEMGVHVVMSKKAIKECRQLEQEIMKNTVMHKLFDTYNDYLNCIREIEQTENSLSVYNSFLDMKSSAIIGFLSDTGFIANGEITSKGIMATHINECNSILLTELIMMGIFDTLSPQEIVALLSIFISSSQKREYDQVRPTIILDHIDTIISTIDDFKDVEHKYNLDRDDDETWTISTSYIDLAYKWANGCEIVELTPLLLEIEEYEGNFLKGMLKIYNIVHDIVCVCKMLGKLNIVQKLETIDSLILRDVVNVTSLYL